MLRESALVVQKMGPTVIDTNPPDTSSFLTTGIWTKLQGMNQFLHHFFSENILNMAKMSDLSADLSADENRELCHCF